MRPQGLRTIDLEDLQDINDLGNTSHFFVASYFVPNHEPPVTALGAMALLWSLLRLCNTSTTDGIYGYNWRNRC